MAESAVFFCPQEMADISSQNILSQTVQSNATLKEKLKSLESTMIQQALKEKIPIRQIAEKLGIDTSTLERKIRKSQLTSRYKKANGDNL